MQDWNAHRYVCRGYGLRRSCWLVPAALALQFSLTITSLFPQDGRLFPVSPALGYLLSQVSSNPQHPLTWLSKYHLVSEKQRRKEGFVIFSDKKKIARPSYHKGR